MSSKSGLVAVCAGSVLPWNVVKAFAISEGLGEGALSFFSSPVLSVGTGDAAAALCCAASGPQSQHNREACSDLAKLLAPGARLYVYIPAMVSA